MLSDDLAAIIGFVCEATLYGSYCVLFIISLLVLRSNRFSQNLSSPIAFANLLLFFCCTVHFSLEFQHYYSKISSGVHDFSAETPGLLVADFLISFTDLLGDLILIYRCWMLWNRNYYVIILPLLSAFAGFACIMVVLHLIITTDPTSPAPPTAVVPLGLAGYILPLATNVFVTTLIAYRIWHSSRVVKDSVVIIGQDASNRAMTLIIESGAIYLVTQFIFVVVFAMRHPAESIMAVIAIQVYGITPTLIIIRVGLGISSEHTKQLTSTRIEWFARPGNDTGTSGTNFTNDPIMMTNTAMEIVHMKDYDLTTHGHDKIEFVGDELESPHNVNHQSEIPSPV